MPIIRVIAIEVTRPQPSFTSWTAVSKPRRARGVEHDGARLPHGSGSGERSTGAINSPPRMGTLGRSDFIGIERQRARARSLESGRGGTAANGVGARDQAAGRTGYASVSVWCSGRCPKNGDISPIRCDRQIGCQPRLTHGACGKTIGDINEVKRVEQRGRTFWVTCMPARARAMLERTRGNRRARRIRRLTTWGQGERRPTAKCHHRHLVGSF
jgi:hypothetical protein